MWPSEVMEEVFLPGLDILMEAYNLNPRYTVGAERVTRG